MPRIRQTARPFRLIPFEALIRLSFRLSIALAGLALLFVAAIYYGLINP